MKRDPDDVYKVSTYLHDELCAKLHTCNFVDSRKKAYNNNVYKLYYVNDNSNQNSSLLLPKKWSLYKHRKMTLNM